jgi:MFS family permease
VSRRSRPAGTSAGIFRSLEHRNYRLYFWGGSVSNVGVWMQRTAQTWVVVQLSGGDGAALGFVTFLQFAPTVLFSLYAGVLGDRLDKVRLLVWTQTALGAIGLVMGALDGAGHLMLWHVYLLAGFLGLVTAFDVPTRQSFVSELVGAENVGNAVGLNAASFNAARLVGPAAAGLAIAGWGTAPVFLANAVCAIAIVTSLLRIDRGDLHRPPLLERSPGQMREGLSLALGVPRIAVLIVLASVVSAFGLNSLQVLLPLVATDVFGKGALEFGLLTSALAVGSLTGALLSSRRLGMPRQRDIIVFVVAFGLLESAAAFVPGYLGFGIALIPIGLMFMGFVIAVNTRVQLSARPDARSRVMAVYMVFFLGGGAIGSPVIGAAANAFGPMTTIGLCGGVVVVVGVVAGAVLRRISTPGAARAEADFGVEPAKLEHPATSAQVSGHLAADLPGVTRRNPDGASASSPSSMLNPGRRSTATKS